MARLFFIVVYTISFLLGMWGNRGSTSRRFIYHAFQEFKTFSTYSEHEANSNAHSYVRFHIRDGHWGLQLNNKYCIVEGGTIRSITLEPWNAKT